MWAFGFPHTFLSPSRSLSRLLEMAFPGLPLCGSDTLGS